MIQPIRLALSVFIVCACGTPQPAAAQAVATVTRPPDGGITVRAVRIAEPIRLDGRLDEGAYSDVSPFVDFVQQEPDEGSPATEKTEAWIFFDDKNIYISARCWDSHPEREIANEMRRDSNNIIQNESFTIIFDSFHDRRNGVFFQTNALGALRDASSTDERSQNTDWNTVWDVRTQRSNAGWTVEFVIPFRSLRYGPGREQTWGINLRRIIGWKSEWVYLSAPPAYLGMPGILAVSKAATLVGLEVPAGARAQAVPQLRRADRPRRERAVSKQRRQGSWRRPEVQPHEKPHPRPDLQHRFRPGGRRHSAGQPDAVQSSVS